MDITERSFVCLDGNAAGDDDGTFSTDSITFRSVPDMLVLYCGRTAELNNFNQADAFASITKITLTTDKDQGCFATATQYQLWQMSVRNGSKQTWQQFKSDQGSVIFVNINSGDLGGYVAGSKEDFTFTITGEFTNTTYSGWAADSIERANGTGQVTDWTFRVVALFRAEIILEDNSCLIKSGMNMGEVIAAIQRGPNEEASVAVKDNLNATNQGWFKDMVHTIKPAMPHILRAGAQLAQQSGDPRLQKLGMVASALGGKNQGYMVKG